MTIATVPPVAVVTGAGHGLGRAIAVALDRAGHAVAVIGRTQATLDETAAMLAGPNLAVTADLTDPAQVRGAFARIADRLGPVAVLVNNAALHRPFAIDEATDAEIVDTIHVGLLAPILCIREALPAMRERGCGDIVNISTQSVHIPQPHMIIYAAAKAGVEVFARGLRHELRGEPIRITTIQPGVIAGSLSNPATGGRIAAYHAAQEKAGLARAFNVPGTSPETIAASVVHAVTAPRDIVLETIEMRGA